MTDRPIVFSAPMVRALLDGRKTQTRRVLSTRNTYRDGHPWTKHTPWDDHDWTDCFVDPGPSPAGNSGPYLKVAYPPGETRHRIYPLYQPGDHLWVRESITRSGAYVQYVADRQTTTLLWPEGKQDARPSIHMPRHVSRLTLSVTDVRVERLQEISVDDARAEGMQEPTLRDLGGGLAQAAWSERQVFSRLWDRLHGKCAWDANPWVAALTFTAARQNIDANPGLRCEAA